MTNVERLLFATIKTAGDELVLESGKPPAVYKNGSRREVTSKELSNDEISIIKKELSDVFKNRKEILMNGKHFTVILENSRIIFTTIPEQYEAALKENIQNSKPFMLTEDKEPVNYNNKESSSISFMLKEMVRLNASDLHISTGCVPIMRIDGDMITRNQMPELTEDFLYSELKKITPKKNIAEFEQIYDTDFAYEIKGLARFRINIFRDYRGIGAVIRKIPAEIISASKLGISKDVLSLCDLPKGLILVTGPTGSGKSTTLAALIDYINENYKKHIITVEDPIEFVHMNKKSLVNQREVSNHTKTFKSALRAALREDPDVILVGELRDLETISIAVEMAVTGHLVMGTLHTSTAVGTIDRIIDQFPADQQSQIRTMLADALSGVISQMLCKKLEGGRVAAHEILFTNIAVANLIREGKTFQIPAIMQSSKGKGMKLLNQALSELVLQRIVSADEALSKSMDKDDLKNTLRHSGVAL